MSHDDTAALIRPIIVRTYGDNGMSRALVECLAGKIGTYVPRDDRDTRERMVMLTCWDWFSGGSTAEAVATDIERALPEAPA